MLSPRISSSRLRVSGSTSALTLPTNQSDKFLIVSEIIKEPIARALRNSFNGRAMQSVHTRVGGLFLSVYEILDTNTQHGGQDERDDRTNQDTPNMLSCEEKEIL